jgi:hypothetical protein
MSSLRGIGAGRLDPAAGADQAGLVIQELRRGVRSSALGAGTLACPRCDAPVAPGPRPLSVSERLGCPYCSHAGALREFLSLGSPTRPAHVVVRVRMR